MTGLNVLLLPDEIQRRDIANCLVVVIDVLRASSTITTALAEGANKIIPVYSPEDAFKKTKTFHPDEVLLCGERNGEKLSGFSLGNSPLEYSSEKVKNKVVLLTTTNGIRTIELVRTAKRVIIGCFLNVQAIVQYCLCYTGEVLLVCAGDRGTISLEDIVCAGMINDLYDSRSGRYEVHYDDSIIALRMYREFKIDLLEMMKTSIWGKHLMKMGFEKDLVYCAQKNIYRHIPVIKNDSIFRLDHYVNSELLERGGHS